MLLVQYDNYLMDEEGFVDNFKEDLLQELDCYDFDNDEAIDEYEYKKLVNMLAEELIRKIGYAYDFQASTTIHELIPFDYSLIEKAKPTYEEYLVNAEDIPFFY